MHFFQQFCDDNNLYFLVQIKQHLFRWCCLNIPISLNYILFKNVFNSLKLTTIWRWSLTNFSKICEHNFSRMITFQRFCAHKPLPKYSTCIHSFDQKKSALPKAKEILKESMNVISFSHLFFSSEFANKVQPWRKQIFLKIFIFISGYPKLLDLNSFNPSK